ncbi:MAG: hypothetical protein ABS939_08185 [Psychrobacillus sp.]
MESTNIRTISIKRGLTRLKTIKAQLNDISSKIRKYGAGSSKDKFDFVDTRTTRKKNHEEARKEVASLYQQFDDLVKEYSKIKKAINKANLETTITIGEKVMTIDDALTYQRHIQDYVRNLVGNYNRSVADAEGKVNRYNISVNVEGLSPSEREEELAHVVYLVDPELIKEKDKFLIEFLEELDGLIDEANVLTQIEISED